MDTKYLSDQQLKGFEKYKVRNPRIECPVPTFFGDITVCLPRSTVLWIQVH